MIEVVTILTQEAIIILSTCSMHYFILNLKKRNLKIEPNSLETYQKKQCLIVVHLGLFSVVSLLQIATVLHLLVENRVDDTRTGFNQLILAIISLYMNVGIKLLICWMIYQMSLTSETKMSDLSSTISKTINGSHDSQESSIHRSESLQQHFDHMANAHFMSILNSFMQFEREKSTKVVA